MRAIVLASFLSAVMSSSAAQMQGARELPLRARITDEAIKQAVRATLAESPVRAASASSGDLLSVDSYRTFSRGFTEAKKPSCLGPDALKHQPAEFRTKNWVIGAGGLVALPFWAAAIARGKCN